MVDGGTDNRNFDEEPSSTGTSWYQLLENVRFAKFSACLEEVYTHVSVVALQSSDNHNGSDPTDSSKREAAVLHRPWN